eukprot:1156244-Pelagomonas_calceolata.AAC.11
MLEIITAANNPVAPVPLSVVCLQDEHAVTELTAVPVLQNAHEMILEMIAWRDPNMIPIKAFYGDDLKVNFAGKLATDPHPMVSRCCCTRDLLTMTNLATAWLYTRAMHLNSGFP